MIRMGMGADDKVYIRNCQAQLFEPLFHMAKKFAVAGIDQDPGGAVNEIGITVVRGHRLPDKGMQIISDFHQVFPFLRSARHFSDKKT
jgi:hypothetical protein